MKPVKKIGWSVVCSIAVLTMAMSTPAQAYDMGDKALRGISGMVFFFLELPGNMVEVSNKEGVGMGLTKGFAQGFVKMPFRGMVGVYEFFTFPFDIQPGYEPVMEPEYPWGYFCGCDKAPAAPKK
jgi:putative exosortase-associated protein (TIGR04073 family)